MVESIRENRSCRISAIVPYPMTNQRIHAETQQNETNRSMLGNYFYAFHRRYWEIDCIRTQSYDLLVSRILAIFMWLYVIIIEFSAFSNIMKPSMTILNFLFGSSYSLKDISSIIYASGTVAYGVSIEIYIILPLAIINCILAINNCGMNHREAITSLVYIVKVLALFAGTELSYQNFKRFTFQQSFQLHYQTASRAMLRQSIYLTVTIIFLVSPGLRSIYAAVRFKCPYSNKTITESYCSIIDIERPVSEEHPTCHPRPCEEVKVDIIEQRQEKQSAVPSAKQSDENSIKTPDPYSYKQIFGVIILCVSLYIVACEIFSIGMKHICTVSKDAILYRYQIMGSCLMIGIGFLGVLFTTIWPFYWLQDKPMFKLLILIEYHCTKKDESSSILWWQKKRFAKIILVICIMIFWLSMFEIGHMFYIIADYIKDKPVWSHYKVYFMASAMLFGGWSLIFAFISCAMILEYVVEQTIDALLLHLNSA